MKLKRKHRGFEARKSLYGFCFIIPWLIGIISLFIVPLGKSLWYSVSEVGFANSGKIVTDFIGFENISYIFKVDPDFITNLGTSISEFAFSFPIIVILSLIFAIILNQNFRGRIFARAIFFLPVIIATGVVMKTMSSSVSGQPVMQDIGSAGGYSVSAIDFNNVLSNLDLPASIISLISEYVNKVFDIVWKTGIQVVLFISGMQTIPEQLYEVSKIEGASKWEEFWFVTIPMLKNIIFLVMLYTMVDLFITVESPVVAQAFGLINAMSFGISSAILWSYILIAIVISGVILFIYKKFSMDRW